MLARILYLSCIRYNHCRVCATWLERDVSLPGCMRIKSVTQYRLSSLQPPRCSSAISQIQTNDPSPPSLPLQTCILSSHRPQAPAKAQVCGTSYATWETWRRLRARFKHSTSCCASGRTFQEVLQRGRSPSLLPTSCLPLHRLQHGKLAPPQYVGNEVSAISADRGRGDACNEFHVQWRTDSRTSKRE